MDAGVQGRSAAARIAGDLAEEARIKIVDLAPERDDGYDLSDFLLEHGDLYVERLGAFPPAESLQSAPTGGPH
jgi:hypothetical protein